MKKIITIVFLQLAFQNALAEMPYKVHIPQEVSAPAPLVVVLHGCSISAENMADLTQFNQLADSEGFIALYPQAPTTLFNPLGCFSWFYQENQMRGGEPQEIVSIAQKYIDRGLVNPNQVYVTGISSGGAMASTLLSCYSDVFSAGAIHSGVAFKVAESLLSGISILIDPTGIDPLELGDKAADCHDSARPVSVMAIHGNDDFAVLPQHMDFVIDQFLRYNDWVDDGSINMSVRQDQITPRVIYSKTHPTTHRFYNNGRWPFIESILVENMAHRWSGGNPDNYFADPDGPDVTRLMWEFFIRATSAQPPHLE